MFGCSDHWIGKRFAHALTGFLADGSLRRRELRAHDAVDADALEQHYEGWRIARSALKAGGAAAALVMADAVLPDAAAASPTTGTAESEWTSTTKPVALGRTHTVPSNNQTVTQGLLDPTKAPILTVDSGDVVVYEKTWTHFLNKLQPGMSADALAELRSPLPARRAQHHRPDRNQRRAGRRRRAIARCCV